MFEKYNKIKRAVFETTLKLLTSNDLQSTSMALISKESGVSMGSIYNNFSGKEEIVNELYKAILSFHAELVQTELDNYSTIREKFIMTWKRIISTHIDYPDAFKFLEQYSLSPYISENSKISNYKNDWCMSLSEIYSEAIQKKLFISFDTQLMIHMHWGAIVYLVKGHLQGVHTLSSDVIEMAIKFNWNSVSTDNGFNFLDM